MDDGDDIFAPFTLNWKGTDYVVPADRCMKLAYVVEMALRQGRDMTVFEALKNPPLTVTAMAYGAALRHAGAVVSDGAVYKSLVESLSSGDETAIIKQALLTQIIEMLLPPSSFGGGGDTDSDEGGQGEKKTVRG